jgi:hypothetical protein
VVLGAVVIAVLVSGCGGGSDSSSSLTKAEYAEQADAICAERKKEWQASLASYQKEVEDKKATNDPEVQKEVAEGVLKDSMLPALSKQLEGLEELNAPQSIEKQVDKMLKSLSAGIEKIEKDGVESLVESGFAEFGEDAKAAGVTCPL